MGSEAATVGKVDPNEFILQQLAERVHNAEELIGKRVQQVVAVHLKNSSIRSYSFD
jgi:hypothetical protein